MLNLASSHIFSLIPLPLFGLIGFSVSWRSWQSFRFLYLFFLMIVTGRVGGSGQEGGNWLWVENYGSVTDPAKRGQRRVPLWRCNTGTA